MATDDEEDDADVPLGESPRIDPSKELTALLDELVEVLKNPDIVGALADRGVNASLALVAIEGLGAYLVGDKAQAAEDLKCVAEEIEGRLKFGDDPPSA
jgi:hypothetical protein